MTTPRLAITMGDIAGVGLEVCPWLLAEADIAGQGLANPGSLFAAVRLAVKLSATR